MKGKVITIIGILIMILVGVTYILFEAFVKDTSNLTAQNIIIAKEAITEGTVIHNEEEALKLFDIKRVNSGDVVEGAIVINSFDTGNRGLMAQITDMFSKDELRNEDVKQLVGYKITRNYAKNEQVLIDYLSSDVVEFDENERLYAIETSYVNSVAAEIQAGDYVDLWLTLENTKGNEAKSRKIIGPLKIYKLKTSDNIIIANKEDSTDIPAIIVFKLDEETIEYLSAVQSDGTIFFTKYGTTPSQEDIDNALENAIKSQLEYEQSKNKENLTDKVEEE